MRIVEWRPIIEVAFVVLWVTFWVGVFWINPIAGGFGLAAGLPVAAALQ